MKPRFSTPAEIKLKLRRMRFGLAEPLPEHWARGSKFLTHFFNAMSVVFPEGEKFFIDAVRQFEEQIDDPALRDQIRGFVAQEGHHTFQHRLVNDLVARHGIDMDAQDRWIGEFLKGVWARSTPEERLGITCALEHYTAILGAQLLENDDALAGFDPRVVPLWRWHAIEETEHKALAFDVFVRCVGSYFVRVRTQVGASLLFIPILHLVQSRLMRQDKSPTTLADVLAGLKYLWIEPGPLRRILPQYLAYYRPGFHPWQHDNRELIARWKQTEAPQYQAA